MPERSLRDFYDRVQHLIDMESYSEAIETARHILRFFPKCIKAYTLMGQACLEQGEIREAVELFQRTLSADPESTTAWIGLASAYEQDELPDVTAWHLERAFELDSSNAGVRQELQKLYSQLHNIKELRLKLNSAALGRIYLKGGMYQQAAGEFHSVLEKEPELNHIKVGLATALWNLGQRVEAAEVCLDLLDELPNCLQANLILGEIWLRGDREEEGQRLLGLAEALDPENQKAQEIFGYQSPLELKQPVLLPLGELPPEMPRRLKEPSITGDAGPGIGETVSSAAVAGMMIESPIESEMAAERADLTEGGEAGELPEWLREAGDEAEPAKETAPEVAEPSPEEEDIHALADKLPDELRALVEEAIEEEPSTAVSEPAAEIAKSAIVGAAIVEVAEDLPDWLESLGDEEETGEIPPAPASEEGDLQALAAELPDELRALVEEAIEEEPSTAVSEPAAEIAKSAIVGAAIMEVAEDLPDWLESSGDEGETGEIPPAPASEEGDLQALAAELPDELRALVEEAIEEQPVAAEMPEDVFAEDAVSADAEPVSAAGTQEEEPPAWMAEMTAATVVAESLEEVTSTSPDERLEEAAAMRPEEPDAEDIPDWLQALAQEPAEIAETPPVGESTPAESEQEEVPDWLRALAQDTPDAVADIPGIVQAAVEPADREVEASEAEAEEVIPGWLDDLRQAAIERPPVALGDELDTPPAREEVWAASDEIEILETGISVDGESGEEQIEPPAILAEEPLETVGLLVAEDLVEEPLHIDTPTAELPTVEGAEELVAEELAEEVVADTEVTPEPATLELERAELPVSIQDEVAAPVSGSMLEEMLVSSTLETEEVEPVVEPQEPAAPEIEEEAPAAEEIAAAPAEETPFITQAMERLSIRPDDHEMRLALARAWRDEGCFEDADEHYAALIQADQYLDSVVEDLEAVVSDQEAGHQAWTVLGDAYMKQGRLSDAMEAYRRALGR